MISLRIRKVVDTSDWDQSFVDGGGSSSGQGCMNLKRSGHGDRVTSGSGTTGAAELRPIWNRKEIEDQELMNWQEAEVMTAYDDDKSAKSSASFDSFPAERCSRHVNPFLDSGHPRQGQSQAYHLVERKSGIALNCRTRGNDSHRDEREFSISVRDLDPRGPKTLPAGDVTAWLDSLKLFDTQSRLRLNRSTSSSPPLLSDHDLICLHDRTKPSGGKSPSSSAAPPVHEERRTPSIGGRPSGGVSVKSSAIDGRSSVFGDESLLERTAAFEGWTAGPFNGGRAAAFEVRVPTIEGRIPAFEGRIPSIEGRIPEFEGRVPTIEGRIAAFEGRVPTIDGRIAAFEERIPSIQGGIPAFEGRVPTIEGRIPAFEGRTPTIEAAFEGRVSAFEDRSPPVFDVRSPAFEGRTSLLNGRLPCFPESSPTADGRAHRPFQSAGPALEVGQSEHSIATAAATGGADGGGGGCSEVPVAYSRAVSFLPAWDLERLETVYHRLDACGFYLGRMTMDEARVRLTGYPVGTFLLRDSSDVRFLFSLSIQTRRGTTSIRVLYECGLFRLDSDPDQSHLMPTFDCVLQLVRHYHRLSAGRRSVSVESPPAAVAGTNSYVLRESTGRRDTPVLLRRPLETTPASLAHSCRRTIHRNLGSQPQNVSRLHLKPSLKDYLSLYPYDI